MSKTPDYSDYRIHTCDDCPNVYLLLPTSTFALCQRDKQILREKDLASTRSALHRFSSICTTCGRLRRVHYTPPIACSLCDQQTLTYLAELELP